MLMKMDFPRIKRLPPYVFNAIGELCLQARRAGEDIIDFGMGNPDAPTPPHIVAKLVEAATKPPNHRYSVSRGVYKLRLAITDWYKRRYGVELDPDSEAIVTIGSKEGIAHLALAILDQGDVVLAPTPTYPIHQYGCIIAGAQVQGVPLRASGEDFYDELTATVSRTWPRPKLLVMNFPHNPTTATVDLRFMKRVADFACENEIMVVHDLAYADLCFDGYKAPSFLQVEGAREIGVEFFTLSKSYNMPGWRVGFAVGNREMIAALARLKSYFDYGMFAPVQVAAIAALNGPQDCVAEINRMYKSRRDVLVNGLNRAGADSGAVPRDGLDGVRQVPDQGSQGRRFAGSRLRRRRRRLRPLRPYRERASHPPGDPRNPPCPVAAGGAKPPARGFLSPSEHQIAPG
jgi:alanine-synthesizing transaminase